MGDALLCEPGTGSPQIPVGELHPGMIVRYDDRIFRVLVAEQALATDRKDVVFVRLRGLAADSICENSFDPAATLEVLSTQRRAVRFERPTPGGFLFSDVATGADIRVAADEIGPKAEFLVPGMPAFIDTVAGRFCGLDFPEFVEIEVADTQTIHNLDNDDVDKPATLANGFRVMVPLHVRKGDKILLHFQTLRYVEPSAAVDKERATSATAGQERP